MQLLQEKTEFWAAQLSVGMNVQAIQITHQNECSLKLLLSFVSL